jgi:UDP-N-acetylglucosamine 1-carboxyvinyltransferase
VHETVYENRFGYTETLKTMGADIQLFTQCLGGRLCRFAAQNYHHSIVIQGPTPLHAEEICIPDLRAGFAYVLAALLAPETTLISGVHYLKRGYEKIVEKLSSIGAHIECAPQKSVPLPLSECLATISQISQVKTASNT